MTCEGCVKDISEALYKLDGVSNVSADLKDQLVRVEGTGTYTVHIHCSLSWLRSSQVPPPPRAGMLACIYIVANVAHSARMKAARRDNRQRLPRGEPLLTNSSSHVAQRRRPPL